jgi:endonuclease/exonuclease/phosphatase family metal-dependent hydrolase
MSNKVRITTFNLENLFNRYAILDEPWENRQYEKFIMALDVVSIASRDGDLVSYETTEIQRNNTAMAILDCKPDILAVQEVENLYTLRNFNDIYLDNYFNKMILIDGNDPRGIDVGLMMKDETDDGLKMELIGIRTHIDEQLCETEKIRRKSVKNFGYIVHGGMFSRDCLEVDVKIGKKTLTFLINHFKAQDKTKESEVRRTAQASKVAEYVKSIGSNGKYPIVLGDLNASIDKDTSLNSLMSSKYLNDPFIGDELAWTHYYTYNQEISRLDYILVSTGLKVSSKEIFRKGLTTKCKQFRGERYPTIGPANTEASDHCPVTVTIEV